MRWWWSASSWTAGAAAAALGRRSRLSVAWMERSVIRGLVRRHEGPRITRKGAPSRLHRRYLARWLRYRNEIARGFPGGLNRLFSCWGRNRAGRDACGRSRCCSVAESPRGRRRIRARSCWRTCGGRTSTRRAAFSAPAGAAGMTRRLRGSAGGQVGGGRPVSAAEGAQVAGSRRRGGGQFPWHPARCRRSARGSRGRSRRPRGCGSAFRRCSGATVRWGVRGAASPAGGVRRRRGRARGGRGAGEETVAEQRLEAVANTEPSAGSAGLRSPASARREKARPWQSFYTLKSPSRRG